MQSRCPHCEVEIEDGARFCGACGRPITATAISQRARAARAAKHSPAAATHPGVAAGARGTGVRCVSRRLCPRPSSRFTRRRRPRPSSPPRRRSRRRPPRPPRGSCRASAARPSACARGPAAGEPDRPDAQPSLRRRGQGRRRGLRRGLPRQADRHGARGGAQDPASAQRLGRDDRRPLPARGRGLLEAARSAHRHHLRLRRDPRRDPLPGDGAPARAEPAPGAEGRGAARLRAGAEDSRSGRGVAGARRTRTASSTAT